MKICKVFGCNNHVYDNEVLGIYGYCQIHMAEIARIREDEYELKIKEERNKQEGQDK